MALWVILHFALWFGCGTPKLQAWSGIFEETFSRHKEDVEIMLRLDGPHSQFCADSGAPILKTPKSWEMGVAKGSNSIGENPWGSVFSWAEGSFP